MQASEIDLRTYYFLYVECGMSREDIYSSLHKKKWDYERKNKNTAADLRANKPHIWFDRYAKSWGQRQSDIACKKSQS